MSEVEFGKRLKALREKKKLSIKEVSHQLNIPPTTYREWEYGRKIKGTSQYTKIAELFEVSLRELIEGTKRTADQNIVLEIRKVIKELKIIEKRVQSFCAND